MSTKVDVQSEEYREYRQRRRAEGRAEMRAEMRGQDTMSERLSEKWRKESHGNPLAEHFADELDARDAVLRSKLYELLALPGRWTVDEINALNEALNILDGTESSILKKLGGAA